jgi:hypothetical protein
MNIHKTDEFREPEIYIAEQLVPEANLNEVAIEKLEHYTS